MIDRLSAQVKVKEKRKKKALQEGKKERIKMPKDKDLLQELADSMIARFDKMEGTILGQGRAIRDELHDRATNLGVKIDEVRSEVTAIGKKVEENRNEILGMEGRLRELEKGNSEFQFAVTKELNEIESKKPNIILFGIPENIALSGNPLRLEDAKVVDSLLQVVAGKKVEFEVKFRIGQRVDGKTRPIVVKLQDEREKALIVQGSTRLKDHDDFKGMYVKADLTKAQREYMKKREEELGQEADRKNALLKNGETWEWKVRGRGMNRHLAKVPKPSQ